jgi:hypothetical protein
MSLLPIYDQLIVFMTANVETLRVTQRQAEENLHAAEV